MATEIWAIILVTIAGLIGGLGPIYLKKGTASINIRKLATIYKNWFLVIGFAIYGVSTVLFIIGLTGGELSILYPLVGLSYVWVSLFSVFMLKEKMTLQKWVGIFIVIVGVALIGFGI